MNGIGSDDSKSIAEARAIRTVYVLFLRRYINEVLKNQNVVSWRVKSLGKEYRQGRTRKHVHMNGKAPRIRKIFTSTLRDLIHHHPMIRLQPSYKSYLTIPSLNLIPANTL